jgi:hypothetical protein
MPTGHVWSNKDRARALAKYVKLQNCSEVADLYDTSGSHMRQILRRALGQELFNAGIIDGGDRYDMVSRQMKTIRMYGRKLTIRELKKEFGYGNARQARGVVRAHPAP